MVFGTRVYGTPFGCWLGRLPDEGAPLFLGLHQVADRGPDDQAGTRAMQLLKDLKSRLGGLFGAFYAKALRGSDVQNRYEIDIPVTAKVVRVGGQPKSRSLRAREFRLLARSTQSLTVHAIRGAPHIETMVVGKKVHVRLEQGQMIKRRRTRAPGSRWYCGVTGTFEMVRRFATMLAGENNLVPLSAVLDRLAADADAAGFARGYGEPWSIANMTVSREWKWAFRSELSEAGHMHGEVEFLLWVSEPAGMTGINIDLNACTAHKAHPPTVFIANRYDFGWSVRAGLVEFVEVATDDELAALFKEFLAQQ